MATDFDPFSPDFQRDPYPFYHKLRAEDPVHYQEYFGTGMWVLTRYADVLGVLQDTSSFSAARFPAGLVSAEDDNDSFGRLTRILRRMFFMKDPPDHTRLRTIFSKAFTPRTVQGLRTRIEHISEGLLDAMSGQSETDLLRDFATPFPVMVIAELMGIRPGDVELKRWSDDLVTVLDLTIRGERLPEAARSAAEFSDYLLSVISDRRKHPRDDFISVLVAASDDDNLITQDELVANLVFLLAAGHETATNMIANGLLVLLANPSQLHKLMSGRTSGRAAIDEILRYESPLQATQRVAATDVMVGNQLIHTGQRLHLVIGAANRDPARFSNPDRLDLDRPDKAHVAFSHGAHFCLGAALVYVEGEIAFNGLLRRLPTPLFDLDRPWWKRGIVVRGLERFPVRLQRS